MGMLYTAVSGLLSVRAGASVEWGALVSGGVWMAFGYSIATTAGAIVTELRLPEPAEKT
jgi:hypothetical protein